jgi:hypothetical protein
MQLGDAPDAVEPPTLPALEEALSASAVETPAGSSPPPEAPGPLLLTRSEQIERHTQQIVATLRIDPETARKLATRAARAGRDANYIPALLRQVTANPAAESPESLFRYRVGNNLDVDDLPDLAAGSPPSFME